MEQEITIINVDDLKHYKVVGVRTSTCETSEDNDAKQAGVKTKTKIEYIYDCTLDIVFNDAERSRNVALQGKWRRDAGKGVPIPTYFKHTFGSQGVRGFILSEEQKLLGKAQAGGILTPEEKKKLAAFIAGLE